VSLLFCEESEVGMGLTNRISHLRQAVALGLVGLLALTFVGCSSKSGKIGDTLTRAESDLEKSEASLKGLVGKPAPEANKELQKVYETLSQRQKEVSGLYPVSWNSFTQQEKERWYRVTGHIAERQVQIRKEMDRVRAELK
jgi:hypothetical protein